MDPSRERQALQTTTLWDFPSQQHTGREPLGDPDYKGATPTYILWNLLLRYTRRRDLVVDPMCGGGTTLDVARALDRKALGYDIAPHRPDIFRADARRLPLEDGKADFVFLDPPYSTHVRYSRDPSCIGELDAGGPDYFEAMGEVIRETHRILGPGSHMALLVSDSFKKGRPFIPIGFRLFAMLERLLVPVDVVAVKRRNRTLLRNHWHKAALEGNYFLRGFHHLFIFRKEGPPRRLGPLEAREPRAGGKSSGRTPGRARRKSRRP